MPSVEQIKQQILEKAQSEESLNELNSTSRTAIYNLWAYVTAFAIWLLYEFFNTYKNELDQKVRTQKLYTLLWFRNAALDFRYGQDLNDDMSYDAIDQDQLDQMKIVKRASVNELELNGRKFLFIKVAKEEEDLTPLTEDERFSLEQYFAQIKPAGTKIVIFSDEPDQLKLDIRFYYDPLVLDENGQRIDGNDNQPVQDAIKDYLVNLKFNGEFSISVLENLLQQVPGCSDAEAYIDNAEANYLNPPEWQSINSTYVANSGYMRIADEDLNIQFIPKTVEL